MNADDPIITRAREKLFHLVELSDSFANVTAAARQAVSKQSTDMADKLEDVLIQYELVESTVNVLQTLLPLITDEQQRSSIMSVSKNASDACLKYLSRLHRLLSTAENLGTETKACLKQLGDILAEAKDGDTGAADNIKQEPIKQEPIKQEVLMLDPINRKQLTDAAPQQQMAMDSLSTNLSSQRLESPLPQQVAQPSNVFMPNTSGSVHTDQLLMQQPVTLSPESSASNLAAQQSLQPSSITSQQFASSPISARASFDPMDSTPERSIVQQQPTLQPHVTPQETAQYDHPLQPPPLIATSLFLDQFEATAKDFAKKTNYTVDDVWEQMLVYALPNEEHRAWADANILNKNLTWNVAKELYKFAFPDPDLPYNVIPSSSSYQQAPIPPPPAIPTAAAAPHIHPDRLQHIQHIQQAHVQSPPVSSTTAKKISRIANFKFKEEERYAEKRRADEAIRKKALEERRQRHAEYVFNLKMGVYDTFEEYNLKYLESCKAADINQRDSSLINRYINSLVPKYREALFQFLHNRSRPIDLFHCMTLALEAAKVKSLRAKEEKRIRVLEHNCFRASNENRDMEDSGHKRRRESAEFVDGPLTKKTNF